MSSLISNVSFSRGFLTFVEMVSRLIHISALSSPIFVTAILVVRLYLHKSTLS